MRVATKYDGVAVGHMFEPDEPKVRQARVDTLTIVIIEERLNALLEDTIEFRMLGLHRQNGLLVQMLVVQQAGA